MTYYANDLVDTIASNGVTLTHNLDPNERLRTFVSSASSAIHTNHYTGDGDSPAWTSENTVGTSWSRWLPGFGGLSATVDQAGTVTNQFVDIHGDIIGTLPSIDTNPGDATITQTDEWGYEVNTSARYDYVGTAERKRDINSGLMLMGARVYNPWSGRFLQADPVLGGSANNYDYVNADPVNSADIAGTSTLSTSTTASSNGCTATLRGLAGAGAVFGFALFTFKLICAPLTFSVTGFIDGSWVITQSDALFNGVIHVTQRHVHVHTPGNNHSTLTTIFAYDPGRYKVHGVPRQGYFVVDLALSIFGSGYPDGGPGVTWTFGHYYGWIGFRCLLYELWACSFPSNTAKGSDFGID
jgi:RHS repeat-associated protein